MQHAYNLGTAPSDEQLAALAEPWRPYRTWVSVLLRVRTSGRGAADGPAPGASAYVTKSTRTTFVGTIAAVAGGENFILAL